MSKRLHVKYPFFLSDLMNFEFSQQIFENISNIKFHQNPSNGSRVVPCGQTDMTKLTVAFRNVANAPKNCTFSVFKRFRILRSNTDYFLIVLRSCISMTNTGHAVFSARHDLQLQLILPNSALSTVTCLYNAVPSTGHSKWFTIRESSGHRCGAVKAFAVVRRHAA